MLDIIIPAIPFDHFLLFIQDVFAQAAATTTPPPAPAGTVIQQVPTTTSGATVDLTTLIGILTPILGGVAGMFFKQKKDMEKNDLTVEAKQKGMIENMILPLLKQNAQVVNQTATQDVKLNEAINLIYTTMGDNANNIQNMPAIQQAKLIEDQIRSKILAEQYQAQLQNVEKRVVTPPAPPAVVAKPTKQPSIVWDEATQSWVSK